jgi:hypothetical protein
MMPNALTKTKAEHCVAVVKTPSPLNPSREACATSAYRWHFLLVACQNRRCCNENRRCCSLRKHCRQLDAVRNASVA